MLGSQKSSTKKEDDEFEEFDQDDWDEQLEDPEDANIWETNWDDSNTSDTYTQALKHQLDTAQKMDDQFLKLQRGIKSDCDVLRTLATTIERDQKSRRTHKGGPSRANEVQLTAGLPLAAFEDKGSTERCFEDAVQLKKSNHELRPAEKEQDKGDDNPTSMSFPADPHTKKKGRAGKKSKERRQQMRLSQNSDHSARESLDQQQGEQLPCQAAEPQHAKWWQADPVSLAEAAELELRPQSKQQRKRARIQRKEHAHDFNIYDIVVKMQDFVVSTQKSLEFPPYSKVQRRQQEAADCIALHSSNFVASSLKYIHSNPGPGSESGLAYFYPEVNAVACLMHLEQRACGRTGQTFFRTATTCMPLPPQERLLESLCQKAVSHGRLNSELLRIIDECTDSSALKQGLQTAIDCDNKGNRMLKALGWQEGQGIGAQQQGILEPVPIQKRKKLRGLGF